MLRDVDDLDWNRVLVILTLPFPFISENKIRNALTVIDLH
jgi:hypothetical protein